MTTHQLKIRCYNVKFGDAILVSIPDRAKSGRVTLRHILIDVGNVLAGEGGGDDVFVPILEDVLDVTSGKPVDLYVMTHEHMDHVQGLLAGHRTGLDVKADHVWITASAAPDYYDRHTEARKRFQLARRAYRSLERQLAAAPDAVNERLYARMLNNNFRKTADCVEHIRTRVCDPNHVHFVHRTYDLANAHAFEEASFEIWAPEEDTSVYYGRFQPLAFGFDGTASASATQTPGSNRPAPPAGVDVGAFNNLLDRRASSAFDNILAIDKATNNTSIVFSIEWRGWRLLFAGDAEGRSWKTMHKEKVIKPVHFLKVSHHGSHNGTPSGDILEALLPADAPDAAYRTALISTCSDVYSGVPHGPTTGELAARCDILDTRELGESESWELTLEG
jgi:beta-lactamase superfamily II metal-dependent hydrolase